MRVRCHAKAGIYMLVEGGWLKVAAIGVSSKGTNSADGTVLA